MRRRHRVEFTPSDNIFLHWLDMYFLMPRQQCMPEIEEDKEAMIKYAPIKMPGDTEKQCNAMIDVAILMMEWGLSCELASKKQTLLLESDDPLGRRLSKNIISAAKELVNEGIFSRRKGAEHKKKFPEPSPAKVIVAILQQYIYRDSRMRYFKWMLDHYRNKRVGLQGRLNRFRSAHKGKKARDEVRRQIKQIDEEMNDCQEYLNEFHISWIWEPGLEGTITTTDEIKAYRRRTTMGRYKNRPLYEMLVALYALLSSSAQMEQIEIYEYISWLLGKVGLRITTGTIKQYLLQREGALTRRLLNRMASMEIG